MRILKIFISIVAIFSCLLLVNGCGSSMSIQKFHEKGFSPNMLELDAYSYFQTCSYDEATIVNALQTIGFSELETKLLKGVLLKALEDEGSAAVVWGGYRQPLCFFQAGKTGIEFSWCDSKKNFNSAIEEYYAEPRKNTSGTHPIDTKLLGKSALEKLKFLWNEADHKVRKGNTQNFLDLM